MSKKDVSPKYIKMEMEEIYSLRKAMKGAQNQVLYLTNKVAKNSEGIDNLLAVNQEWVLMVKVAVIVAVAVTVGVMILNTIGETL